MLIESTSANKVVEDNFQSPLADPEIENFFEKGKFYPNDELEKKTENFKQNRPHNRFLSIPQNLAK